MRTFLRLGCEPKLWVLYAQKKWGVHMVKFSYPEQLVLNLAVFLLSIFFVSQFMSLYKIFNPPLFDNKQYLRQGMSRNNDS